MKENKITPEIILANQPNIPEAMKEFAGIKIIEALEIITKDFPKDQREEIMSNIDIIMHNIL